MSDPTLSWQPQRSNVNPYAAPKVQQKVRMPGSRDPLGGRGERFGAAIIDGIIFFPGGFLIGFGSGLDPEYGLMLLLLGVFLYAAAAIVQIILLVMHSASVGKKLLGLYIADFDSGAPAGWVATIMLRAIVNGILTAIPCAGSIYGLVDVFFIFRPDRRCVHDFIARTVVLKRS